MLPMIASVSRLVPTCESQGASRQIISLGFNGGPAEHRECITVTDLSRTKVLFQASPELRLEQNILIDIPRAGRVDARIVKRENERIDAVFETPIDHASVRAVRLAAPMGPSCSEQAEMDAVREAYQKLTVAPQWFVWLEGILSVTLILAFLYALWFLPISN